MIAFRSPTRNRSGANSSTAKSGKGKSNRVLVQRLESLYSGLAVVGSVLYGRYGQRSDVVWPVPAKSSVGSDSVGTEPNAERECGA
jgi:hypothetical protein